MLYYLDSTSNNYDIVKMKTNGDNKEIILNDVDATKFTIENDWIYYFKDSKKKKSTYYKYLEYEVNDEK